MALADKHGRQELERACAKALSYSPRPSYKTIKSIIAKSAEPSGEDPDVGAYPAPGATITQPSRAKETCDERKPDHHGQAVRNEVVGNGPGVPGPGGDARHRRHDLRRALRDDRGRGMGLAAHQQADPPAAPGGLLRPGGQRHRHPLRCRPQARQGEDRRAGELRVGQSAQERGDHWRFWRGKSWLACALGVAACNAFHSVRYTRMPEMLDELTVSKDEEWLKSRSAARSATC